MRTHGPHICPNCGERVTMFAAGCALCGAALDPRRAQQPSTLERLLRRTRLARKEQETRVASPDR